MHIDLQFIKSWGAYNAGEVARFAKQQAHALIERGVALERAAVGEVEHAVAAVLGSKETSPVDAKDVPEASGSDPTKPSTRAKSNGSIPVSGAS